MRCFELALLVATVTALLWTKALDVISTWRFVGTHGEANPIARWLFEKTGLADKLLEPEISDVDGNQEKRNSTISVFEGDAASVSILEDEHAEIQHVAQWIQKIIESGVSANEVCVIVRSEDEVNRAKQACMASGTDFQILDEKMEAATGKASICTMHLAKGLEYRAVAVMACDDCIIPLESRMKASGDDADLEITYETERHLLYVACTRARDYLMVTAVKPGSEFLEGLMA
jgi:superfamily I DNA/RNA helicase